MVDCLRASVPVYDDDGNGCYSWMAVRAGENSKFCKDVTIKGDLTVEGTINQTPGGGSVETTNDIICDGQTVVPAGTNVVTALENVSDYFCDETKHDGPATCERGNLGSNANRTDVVFDGNDTVKTADVRILNYLCRFIQDFDITGFNVGVPGVIVPTITFPWRRVPIVTPPPRVSPLTGTAFEIGIVQGVQGLYVVKPGVYEVNMTVTVIRNNGNTGDYLRFALASTNSNPNTLPVNLNNDPNWAKLQSLDHPCPNANIVSGYFPNFVTKSTNTIFAISNDDISSSTVLSPLSSSKAVFIQMMYEHTLPGNGSVVAPVRNPTATVNGTNSGYDGTGWNIKRLGDVYI